MAKYYGGISESSGNTGAGQGNTSGDPFASGAAQSDPLSSGASQDALSGTASQAGALSSDTAQLDQAPSQMLQGSVQQTQLFGEVSNDFANQPPGNPSGGGCSMPPLKAMTPQLDPRTPPPPQTPPPPPNIPLIPQTATSATPPPAKPLIGKVVQDKFILEISKTQTPPPGTTNRPLIGKVQKNKPANGDNNKPVDLKSDEGKPDEEKEKEKEKKEGPSLKTGIKSDNPDLRKSRPRPDGRQNKKKRKFEPEISFEIPLYPENQFYKDPQDRFRLGVGKADAAFTKKKDGLEAKLEAEASAARWNFGKEDGVHGQVDVGNVKLGAQLSVKNTLKLKKAEFEAGADLNLVTGKVETPQYEIPSGIPGQFIKLKIGAGAGLGVGAKFKIGVRESVKEGLKAGFKTHTGFGPSFDFSFDWGLGPSEKGGKK